MKRSPMKPGTTPIKRGTFARKPADATGVLRVQYAILRMKGLIE